MSFQLNCGHCGVASVGRVIGHTIKHIDANNWYPYCLVHCDACRKGNLLSFHVNSGWENVVKHFDQNSVVIPVDILADFKLHPERVESIPGYLPPLLNDAYADAEYNFWASRWKSAAQLFLQCLEFACVLLESDGNEESAQLNSEKRIDLTKRINSLFEDGRIPAGLKDWAHQIRVIGQFHKHRYTSASEEDCCDIRDFVEMFLRFSFSIPGQIEARRERIRSAAQSDESLQS